MRCRRLFAFACLIAGAAIAQAAKEPFPGVDDKWRCYETPHFELFSRADDADSRELLESLELLHAMFLETARIRARMPLPVTIYYFRDEDAFLPYVPAAMRSEERTAAFYLRRPDRAVIVVSPTWGSDWARRLIFHEYIHHMTAIAGDDPPLWYAEGVAELFSTIKENSDGLEYGESIPEHLQELRKEKMMPLAALFATDHTSGAYNEDKRAGMFYAESWAFMHYWYCGNLKLTPERLRLRDRFFEYIRSETEKGDPEVRRQLFEQALGRNYATMARDLESYVERGTYYRFKVPRPKIASRESYVVRPVSRDEIRRQLATLDLRVNRSPLAKLALLDAISRNPADYIAYETLGMDAAIDGNDNEARDRWNQALAAGSTNPAIFHELAAIEDRTWFSRFDLDFRLPAAAAERLRNLLHRSIESAPDQSQAYEILAWVEAAVEKPSAKEINLVQQHVGAMSDKNRTLLALAVIRVRVGDFKTARTIVGVLEKSPRRPEISRACATLREYIAQHAPDETPPEEAPKPEAGKGG